MSPKVAAGNSIKANTLPTIGTKLKMDTAAMKMKNKPANASGWRKKVFIPATAQVAPVRAVTM
jgi:hypothetical protein